MSSSPARVGPGHLADLLVSVSPPVDVLADGLLRALSLVPDPRARRGVRHAFTAVLAVAVCAVLAGAQSYAAIAEWAADTSADQRQGPGLPARGPHVSTIWRVLTRIDPVVLDKVIGDWLARCLSLRRGRPARRGRRVMAVDGKTIRGARAHDGQDRAPHLMACLDHTARVVLGQVAVDGKTNEIPMFATLLDQIPGSTASVSALPDDPSHTFG